MMQSESTVSDTMTQTSDTGGGGGGNESPDVKIAKDLASLEEKIDLCQTMLSTESNIDSNEALIAVIGFLEACQPRISELIEVAATQGVLGEEILEKCLVVNDRLTTTLEDCDEEDPSKRKTAKAAVSSAAAAAGGNSGPAAAAKARTDTEKEFDDLLGSTDSPPASPKQPPKGGGKSTGEEDSGTPVDPFAGEPDILTPTPVGSASAEATAQTAVGGKAEPEDLDAEFDDFLKERSSGDKDGN
mmetsp:Transcript_32020/g.95914  ORF Transcript_32020/g.95914 Transcript_32020/m.95914 type:complete len:244 (-) Transcript_32020:298-1029(-)